MLENLIYTNKKSLLTKELEAGNVPENAIAFIGDTKEIYAQGQYFAGSYTGITYSELVTLRDNSQLIPGKQYRITDYITTTTQAETQSAGHQFDVIVTADTVNILNETARITNHEGDTYFVNENLAAFQIKYCLDNDTTRFSWADTANGKGVIYYMKDQHNNETPYDFKNIQFKRYKVLLNNEYCVDYKSYIENDYVGFKPMNSSGASMHADLSIADENDFKWYYTFSRLTDETDASVNSEGKVHDNVILPVVEDDDNLETHALNNIVFISDMVIAENKFNDCCFLMTFVNNIKDLICNYIGSYSRGNILKNCLQNYISNNFQRTLLIPTEKTVLSNTIGQYYKDNIIIARIVQLLKISNEFKNNVIVTTGEFGRINTEDYFMNNIITCSNFAINIIGANFQHNNITGGNFVQNIIGHMCQYNTFGNYFMNSVIGTYFKYNTFKTGIDANSEYMKVRNCNFGQNVEYNNFYSNGSDTDYIKNLKVQSTLQGTSSAINHIKVPCNAINEITVAKDNNGNIVVSNIQSQIGDINTVLESIINGNTNNLITFIVNDKEYQAEEGMTWEEWVNSKYNTENWKISNNYILPKGGTLYYANRKEIIPWYVYKSDKINNLEKYSIYGGMGGD